jgi:hypothetical protein
MDIQLMELVKQTLDSKHTIKEKQKLLNELRKLGAPEENRWHFRYVIWTLALVAISIPIVVLWSIGKSANVDVPSGLLSLGSAAVGALAAFLTPHARRQDENSSEPPPAPPLERQAPLQQNKPPDNMAQDGGAQAGGG